MDFPCADDPIFFALANPKRKGSKAHDRYSKYCSARTVREALNLGAFQADLSWDFHRGFLSASQRDTATASPVSEAPLLPEPTQPPGPENEDPFHMLPPLKQRCLQSGFSHTPDAVEHAPAAGAFAWTPESTVVVRSLPHLGLRLRIGKTYQVRDLLERCQKSENKEERLRALLGDPSVFMATAGGALPSAAALAHSAPELAPPCEPFLLPLPESEDASDFVPAQAASDPSFVRVSAETAFASGQQAEGRLSSPSRKADEHLNIDLTVAETFEGDLAEEMAPAEVSLALVEDKLASETAPAEQMPVHEAMPAEARRQEMAILVPTADAVTELRQKAGDVPVSMQKALDLQRRALQEPDINEVPRLPKERRKKQKKETPEQGVERVPPHAPPQDMLPIGEASAEARGKAATQEPIEEGAVAEGKLETASAERLASAEICIICWEKPPGLAHIARHGRGRHSCGPVPICLVCARRVSQTTGSLRGEGAERPSFGQFRCPMCRAPRGSLLRALEGRGAVWCRTKRHRTA